MPAIDYRAILYKSDTLIAILTKDLMVKAYVRNFRKGERVWELIESWPCQVRDLDPNYWDWDERLYKKE